MLERLQAPVDGAMDLGGADTDRVCHRTAVPAEPARDGARGRHTRVLLSGLVAAALCDCRRVGRPDGRNSGSLSWVLVKAAFSGRILFRHLDVLAARLHP